MNPIYFLNHNYERTSVKVSSFRCSNAFPECDFQDTLVLEYVICMSEKRFSIMHFHTKYSVLDKSTSLHARFLFSHGKKPLYRY